MDKHRVIAKKFMEKAREKRSEYLESAKPGPISDEYRFSNTGLYLITGGRGSGKTHFISQHLLITDLKKLYNEIVFVTTTNRIDETFETFIRGIQNASIYVVPQDEAIEFLTKLFKHKMKFYALYRAINV
jgi:predicted AAA+ superfamily ATPase